MEQENVEETSSEKTSASAPSRSIWSGNITIGLVNVPVKLFSMIYDKGITFHFLHKTDGQPLKYVKMCTKDDKIVPWNEVVRGYEVAKNEYITFDQKELNAAKPESDKRIRISKFVDYFSVDPVYFDRTYALLPDKSKDAYGLLLEGVGENQQGGRWTHNSAHQRVPCASPHLQRRIGPDNFALCLRRGGPNRF